MSLPTTEIHRNQEAEDAILSAMLNLPHNVAMVSEGLPPDVFYHVGNRTIYAHLLSMGAEGAVISVPTLAERLSHSGELEKIGGVSLIMGLMDKFSIPTQAVVAECKQVVKSAWLARCATLLMMQAIAEGRNEGRIDPASWIMATAERLQALGQDASPRHRSMKELVTAAIDRYQAACDLQGKLAGISTGFKVLDALTGGFMPGHLWVIGGGTSDGKSAYVQQMMLAVGRAGMPCAIYTLEMSDDENVDRFFAQLGQISSESFMRGTFSADERAGFTRAMDILNGSPIHIRDVSGIKKTELLADMRLLWRIYGIKVFAIDYGQLIGSEGKHFNREREVADFSASLKAFAKQTKSTVIFVSQLNEEGRLRESRAIGFDADKAARLRPVEDENGNIEDGRRLLHLDKNRGGKRYVKVHYDFHGETFTFKNERIESE